MGSKFELTKLGNNMVIGQGGGGRRRQAEWGWARTEGGSAVGGECATRGAGDAVPRGVHRSPSGFVSQRHPQYIP